MAMLLQHIVGVFDTELARLQRLRAVVANLAVPMGIPELPAGAVEVLADEVKQDVGGDDPVPAKGIRRLRRARGLPRCAAVPRTVRPVDHGALTSSIPKGPVVVSRATLEQRKAEQPAPRTPEQRPPAKVGTLGSMIRAMRLEVPESPQT